MTAIAVALAIVLIFYIAWDIILMFFVMLVMAVIMVVAIPLAWVYWLICGAHE